MSDTGLFVQVIVSTGTAADSPQIAHGVADLNQNPMYSALDLAIAEAAERLKAELARQRLQLWMQEHPF